MEVYTYSKARQNFALLLQKAVQEGVVHIKRKDGQVFILKPVKTAHAKKSPFNFKGLNLKITKEEILDSIHEARRG